MYRETERGSLLEAVLSAQAPHVREVEWWCGDHQTPHGWCCTLPKGHTGFHVAHGGWEARLKNHRPIAMWDAS